MIILVGIIVLVLCVAHYSHALSLDVVGLPIRAWAETKFTTASKMYKLVTCYRCNTYWISLIACTAALILTSLYLHNWWPMAWLPFGFPAVGYGAYIIVDKVAG